MSDSRIERLDALIAKGDEVLATHTPHGPNVIGFPTLNAGAFTGWRSQALTYLEHLLGPKHTYAASFAKQVELGYKAHVQQGQAILKAVKEDLAAGIIAPPSKATPIQTASAFDSLDKIASRLHSVICQLRIRHDGRSTLDVSDEYDVQDLLHALLHIYFDDIRPEEWTPSYAGKSSRVDFLLKNERTVIEVKMSRAGLGSKELGTQLIEDKARYEKHAECDQLFCLVYDPDHRVANPRGFENDLSVASGDFRVRVRVVPQGY